MKDERIVETHRAALKGGAGLGLAALLLAGASRVAIAQEATPAAVAGLEGRYVNVRSRKLRADADPEALLALVREGFVPLIQTIPGFVAYYVVADPETRDQIGISIFADKAGADESTRLRRHRSGRGRSDGGRGRHRDRRGPGLSAPSGWGVVAPSSRPVWTP